MPSAPTASGVHHPLRCRAKMSRWNASPPSMASRGSFGSFGGAGGAAGAGYGTGVGAAAGGIVTLS